MVHPSPRLSVKVHARAGLKYSTLEMQKHGSEYPNDSGSGGTGTIDPSW